jgi:hypothetical protein
MKNLEQTTKYCSETSGKSNEYTFLRTIFHGSLYDGLHLQQKQKKTSSNSNEFIRA